MELDSAGRYLTQEVHLIDQSDERRERKISYFSIASMPFSWQQFISWQKSIELLSMRG